MKKTIIIYGLIAGIIASIAMLFNANTIIQSEGIVNFDNSMIVGYASMLIAFSLVFVCIKNYRDKVNGGVISFGKSFKIGISIVLIASTLYVLIWLIAYFYFIPDFMDKYSIQMLKNLKADGADQIAIDSHLADMVKFGKLYKNPIFTSLMTYMEIIPTGIFVTLISALILKKKQ